MPDLYYVYNTSGTTINFSYTQPYNYVPPSKYLIERKEELRWFFDYMRRFRTANAYILNYNLRLYKLEKDLNFGRIPGVFYVT